MKWPFSLRIGVWGLSNRRCWLILFDFLRTSEPLRHILNKPPVIQGNPSIVGDEGALFFSQGREALKLKRDHFTTSKRGSIEPQGAGQLWDLVGADGCLLPLHQIAHECPLDPRSLGGVDRADVQFR